MKFAAAFVLVALSIALMSAFLLGASSLDQNLAFGLDAGVVTAAISLILGASAPLLLLPREARSRFIAILAFGAAIAWLPFSIILAGGTQLSYSGWQSVAWLVFTCLLLLAIVTGWIISLVRVATTRSAA